VQLLSANHQLTVQTIPGPSLSDADRRRIIALCNRAYGEDLEPLFSTFVSPTHVLGRLRGRLVSHALWVTRYLQAGSGPLLRTAYVEAVATDPAYRHRGFATAVMQRLAADVQDFELAALSPSDPAFYERLGWELWQGPLFIRTDDGLLLSPGEEQVMILRLPRTPPLDLDAPLSAEWRQGELW
jgi:aminoglycoside 2'-N-acetyltransferase I